MRETPHPPLTRERFLSSLENYFGPTAESQPIREMLQARGAEVLEHAREMLRVPVDEDLQWSLLCAIHAVHTRESAELLLAIFLGLTSVDPEDGSDVLDHLCSTELSRSVCRASDAFFGELTRLADADCWLDRNRFLSAVEDLEWIEAVGRVRELTKDPNLSTRRRAQDTLREITGDDVSIELPLTRFPAENLLPPILGAPELLEDVRGRRARFVHFSVLESCLHYGDGALERIHGGGRGRWTRTRFRRRPEQLLDIPTPAGETHRLVLGAIDHFEASLACHGVGPTWDRTWKFQPDHDGTKSAALLFDEGGAFGVALGVGSDAGVVAIDLEGQPLWSIPRQHVLYELSTHPGLPGWMLQSGWDAYLRRTSRSASGARVQIRFEKPSLYVQGGLLFPDEGGEARCLIRGTARDSEPCISCHDEEGRELWRAPTSYAIGKMSLLDSPAHGLLLVIATEGRELLFLDTGGTLRHRIELPDDPEQSDTIYGLDIGNIDRERQAIVVRMLGRTLLYPVLD